MLEQYNLIEAYRISGRSPMHVPRYAVATCLVFEGKNPFEDRIYSGLSSALGRNITDMHRLHRNGSTEDPVTLTRKKFSMDKFKACRVYKLC